MTSPERPEQLNQERWKFTLDDLGAVELGGLGVRVAKKVDALIKQNGFVGKSIRVNHFKDEIGFFLAGIIDAEGSCGFKKSGFRMQPFFAVAMMVCITGKPIKSLMY